MNIFLITTGGTIDGADSDKGVTRPHSGLLAYLRTCEPANLLNINSQALCNKDSRKITNTDRAQLLDLINRSTANHILIGHGTHTMCETGRFLKLHLKETSKTVLLVGAWIPFGDANSDAPAQAQYAVDVFKKAPRGVYIAMDGKLWDPDVTEKKEVTPGKWGLVS